MSIVYELEKKSSLVTRAFSAKSCTRDTDSLHSCTRLRLVQEMACLYHECKILPRKHSYPNLIPIAIIINTDGILLLVIIIDQNRMEYGWKSLMAKWLEQASW